MLLLRSSAGGESCHRRSTAVFIPVLSGLWLLRRRVVVMFEDGGHRSSNLSIVLSSQNGNQRRYCYRPRRFVASQERPKLLRRLRNFFAGRGRQKVVVVEEHGGVGGRSMNQQLKWRLAGGIGGIGIAASLSEIPTATESLSFRRSRWIGELESKVVIQRSSAPRRRPLSLVRGRRELRIAGSMLPVGGEIHTPSR
nr:hypothetical protein Iba_chr07aCG9600 [Ipomoea batatas]